MAAKHNLNILSFNARGLTSTSHTEIKVYLDENPNIDIICIQETKLNNNITKNIPGYIAHYKYYKNQNNNVCGGLVTYFKNKLNVEEIIVENPRDQKGNIAIEMQLFKLYLNKSTIHLANIYSRGCDLEALNKMSTYFTNGLRDCVINGDLNSHHPMWGSQKQDSGGRDVLAWTEKNDLVILNDGSPTRVDAATGQLSCIDLTITSPNISAISGWGVVQDTWDSDHFPIITSIFYNTNTKTAQNSLPSKFNYNKADWENFTRLCGKISRELVYNEDIDIFNSNLIAAMSTVAREVIPVTSSKPSERKNVPWWNDECKLAVQGRKNALNNLKRSICAENLSKYRTAEQEAKITILNAKKKNWEEFCVNCSIKDNNSKIFWDKIHRINGIPICPIPLLKQNDKIAKTDSEKAQFLIKHYVQVASDSNFDSETLEYQHKFESQNEKIFNTPGENNTPLNYSFTLSELKKIISTRKNSAVGLDGASYQMFKRLPDSVLLLWLELYNKAWSEGVYPEAWKQSCVVPIPKFGKNKNDPGSYRPISLTSHPGKLMEGMVKARLEHFLESKNLLNPFQSGFRKGRSTLDQLARLVHDIQYAKNRGRSVLAIFLDLTSAFDLTWTRGILYKLKEYGITGDCFRYLSNFLTGRKILVKVGDSLSDEHELTRGTPQGAILSPLLFNILINNLPATLEGTGMVISQFADDSANWKSGANLKKLQSCAQRGLDSIWGWAKNWGFKLSKTKTVGILFGNQNQHSLDVNLGGTPIKFECVVTFLGMLLDRKLSFRLHILKIKERCSRDMNLLRMLRGTDFGSDKNSLLTLYKSLIRPKIDYGAQIYSSAKPSILKILDTIQNQALKIVLRAICSTPAHLLEMEAGVTPLAIRRQEQCAKYWARAQTTRVSNPVNAIFGTGYYHRSKQEGAPKPFGARVQDLVEEFGLKDATVADFRPNPVEPWTLQQPDVCLKLSADFNKNENPNLIQAVSASFIDSKFAEHLQIYTDGSKEPNSGKVSAAYVIPSLKISNTQRLSNNLSIYTAELTAIKNSLCWILENKNNKTAIFSDSLSALTSLKTNHSQSRPDILTEIIILYNQCLKNNLEVTLVWCPAHVGLSGNERADRAAKEGLNHEEVDTVMGLAPTEIYSIIRKRVMQRWKDSIAAGPPLGPAYNTQGPSLRRPVCYSKNSRLDKCITRLRLGTNLLPGSVGQYIKKLDPTCARCGVKNDTEHFLMHCSVHRGPRDKLQSEMVKVGLPFTIINVLEPSKATRTSVYKALAAYIVDCEMTDKI